MIERGHFELVRERHGGYASWALWAAASGKPKSNVGDLSVFNPDANPALLRTLRTDVIMVGLNIAETEARLGPIDFLVNNAGSASVIGPVWETDPDDWWREMEVNLRGPLLCARAVLPGMIARRRGRIVNMAAGVGLTPAPYTSAYACSKVH